MIFNRCRDLVTDILGVSLGYDFPQRPIKLCGADLAGRQFRPYGTARNVPLRVNQLINPLKPEHVSLGPNVFHGDKYKKYLPGRAGRKRWRDNVDKYLNQVTQKSGEQQRADWGHYDYLLRSCLDGLNPQDIELAVCILEKKLGIARGQLLFHVMRPDECVVQGGTAAFSKPKSTSLDAHVTWLSAEQIKIILTVLILHFHFQKPEQAFHYNDAYESFVRLRELMPPNDEYLLAELLRVFEDKKTPI